MSFYECTGCNKILKEDEVDWVNIEDSYRGYSLDSIPVCTCCRSECEEIEWSPSFLNPDEDISY